MPSAPRPAPSSPQPDRNPAPEPTASTECRRCLPPWRAGFLARWAVLLVDRHHVGTRRRQRLGGDGRGNEVEEAGQRDLARSQALPDARHGSSQKSGTYRWAAMPCRPGKPPEPDRLTGALGSDDLVTGQRNQRASPIADGARPLHHGRRIARVGPLSGPAWSTFGPHAIGTERFATPCPAKPNGSVKLGNAGVGVELGGVVTVPP
jgi:hypothetical protein